MSTCDVHTLPASVAKHRTEFPLQSPRERRLADAASTVTTVSVRRQPRRESQDAAPRRAAAAPAAPVQAAHASGRLAAAPGAIAAMLATAARHLNATRRPSWIALVASAVAAGAVVWWVMVERQPNINADTVVRDNLAAAQAAAHEGRYSDPPEHSALHYYSTVLAIDPTNATAIRGVDTIADRYLDDAKRSIIEGQYAQAALALEKVRRIRPDHRRLPLLDAQLRKELKELLAQQREAAAAQQLNDATKAVQAKPHPAKSAGQTRSPGLMAALVAAPAVSSPGTSAAMIGMTPASLSTAGTSEGTNRAPEATPEASVRNSVAAGPKADESSSGGAVAAAAAAGAAGAAAVADVGHGTSEIASAIPAGGAGSASGTAVSPESPPPVATPAPDTRSAPAPRSRALLRFVQPDYPSEAVLRGYEGWVDVALDVTPAGVVVNPRVEDTSNGRIFNRAALAAVRQWRYQPHDGAGGTEPEHIKVRVEFKLTR